MNKAQYRPRSRWVFVGKLEFITAVTIAGNNSVSSTDSPVLRDKRSGKFLLPGSTIAGALRNNLHERLDGYFTKNENESIGLLFGSSNDENSLISNVIFYDSISDKSHTEVRDGVQIGKDGIAVDKFKYDFEVIPAGTEFSFRVDLVIPQNTNKNNTDENCKKSEEKLLSNFLSILEELQSEKIRFGIKKTRGLGQCKVKNWQYERYDLMSKDGWDKWLASPSDKPFNDNTKTYENIIEAIESQTDFLAKMEQSLEDKREKVELILDLAIENSFIIRSGGQGQDEPDAVSLTSNGKPIVAGTSIAGCLRARMLDILNNIGSIDAEAQTEKIFGPSATPRENGAKPKASPLRVNECIINDTQTAHITRVKIDRFTGGALDTALFDEQVHVGGNFTVNLELRGKVVKDSNVGILLLLAKDLMTGSLPIGGESSVGRGFLVGNGLTLNVFNANQPTTTFKWTKEEQPCDECVEAFNGYVACFNKECEV